MDREKVIKEWEFVLSRYPLYARWDLIDETLTLLKEQEAVKPYVTGLSKTFESCSSWWYACGNCNKPIDMNDKYCRHCGRSVKWE